MSFFSLFSKNNKSSSSTSNKHSEKLLSKMANEDLFLQEKLEKLEKQKSSRTLNLLEEEQKIQENKDNKFRDYQNKNNNDKLIQLLITDEKHINQLVSSNQNDSIQKSKEHLRYLTEIEKTSKELINNTLIFNRLFQMDFQEKYSKCDLIKHIKFDDKLKLRENDNEFALKLEKIIEQTNVQRCVLVNKVSNSDLSEMEKLNNLLNTSNCYRQVLKEHLKSMYNQLKYLTASELQKQSSELNKQINNLSNERITLTQLLVDFIDKKKQNQKRLLLELEAQHFELETTSKWLSNYSNLVNDMPSELTFSRNAIDPTLLHRVCTAGGSHLLLFILENELKLPLTKEYLVNMGVCSNEDQEILINSLNNFPTPSAPLENEFPSAPLENELPSAPHLEELECIICMETQFDVLFVPCGHLCCCWNCSEKITLCPMCRANIINKFDVKNIF